MTSFRGSWVALTTPFHRGGLDLDAWRRSLKRQLGARTAGIVVAGTTGEGPTLSNEERAALYAEAERSGLHWIASIGTSDTRTSVGLAERAKSAGAHGLLVATPAYSRPSQRGLSLHFGAIAEATPLPVVLYDVPARTAVSLEVGTALDLGRAHANVVAIKEASGDLARIPQLKGVLEVLWGEDATLPAALDFGVRGAISVLGNLFPSLMRELVDEANPALAARLAPWNDWLYRESNPAPLKAVLSLSGEVRNELRAPLATVDARTAAELEAFVASEAETFDLENVTASVNANGEPR